MSTYDRQSGWVRHLSGVIVAMCTPFELDGSVDSERVPSYIDFLVSRGVAAVMVGGTTGEFIAMSVRERATLISTVVRSVDGRVPVIAHVGHVVLEDALRLADGAATAGATALATIVPYFQPYSEPAIIDHLRSCAGQTPELPIFVYNYPAVTGNRLTAEGFVELLDAPNIAGIKLSMETMYEIEPFLQFLPDVCVASGNDAVWGEFTAKGGRAVVSGNAAVVPELAVAMLQSYLAGDEHEVERLKVLFDEINQLAHDGAPLLLKEILRSRGLDIGSARIRSVSPRETPPTVCPSDTLSNHISWQITSV